MPIPSECNVIPDKGVHVISSFRTTDLVPTIFEKLVITRDLDDVNSSSKLAALKKRDPFTYFSIPALRKADWHNNEVDATVLRRENRSIGRKVTRQTRISMECHADLLLADLALKYNSIALPIESTASGNCSYAPTKHTTTPIPTIFEKPVKNIDLNFIGSASKFDELKRKNPFIYDSIPALGNSARHIREVDVTVPRIKNRSTESRVTKPTRVSVECHADLLMEDFVSENNCSQSSNLITENHDDLYEGLFSFEKSGG